MRKFIVELEADTEESLEFIENDIQQELACASTFFYNIKVTEATTVDAEPVIHAHWIYIDDGDEKYATYRCSHCHKEVTVDAERICDIGFVIEDLKRCLECGAKMDEVTK